MPTRAAMIDWPDLAQKAITRAEKAEADRDRLRGLLVDAGLFISAMRSGVHRPTSAFFDTAADLVEKIRAETSP